MNIGFLAVFFGFVNLIRGQAQDDYYSKFCTRFQHFSTDAVTCCDGKALTPGFVYSDAVLWKDCAISPEDKSENLVGSLWRIYNCLVEKSLNGKNLNLGNFAEMMTKNYPEAIKMKIFEKISLSAIENDSLLKGPEAYKNLMKIRSNYYYAEMKVCYNKEDLPKPEDECNSSQETFERRGDCCSNIPIPIIPGYQPKIMSEADMSQCTSDLMRSVGNYNENIPFNESFAKNQCSLTCILYEKGVVKRDKEPISIDYYLKSLFEYLIPSQFSKDLQSYIKEYVISQLRKEDQNLFTRADQMFNHVISKEFFGFDNDWQARELFATCEFHNVFASVLETAIYNACDGAMEIHLKKNPFGEEKLLI